MLSNASQVVGTRSGALAGVDLKPVRKGSFGAPVRQINPTSRTTTADFQPVAHRQRTEPLRKINQQLRLARPFLPPK
jgi:hypothetical protein